MNVGSLFSGIGGFDLGFERAGMRTVWFCEQDPYCQRVLARHWPGVPIHPDVRALVADSSSERRWQDVRGTHGNEGADEGRTPQNADLPDGGGEGGTGQEMVPVQVPPIDLLAGGFPCQDISVAGKGEGIGGSRSGLWGEFARLIGELRPRYVVIENVPALTSRGLDRVLADLAARGFDAEWDCLPASAFGAPHRRDRIWIVAYPAGLGRQRGAHDLSADALSEGGQARPLPASGSERSRGSGGEAWPGGTWSVEPDVGRVAARIPNRVDRLRSLGNALVPQIAEWIGRRLMEHEA